MTEAAAQGPTAGGPDTSRPPGPGTSGLLSDDRLTHRATKGDRRAFEAIYKRYHQDLYRFCLAMVGNPQDAQDALQNTMVKVLRALPGEMRHIQLKPWLYRIARNESVETIRRRRDSVEIEPEHTVSREDLADTVETRERLRRLIADLEELPERQRAALVMRELADLGFAQIGESFETSAAVARQTVYEARLSLRQMEEGREMSCDTVMRELSDADGRVTRRREVRAHLRACPSCRAFRDSMATRRGELAAIAPLPLAVSAGLLHGILSGKASAATLAGGAAGTGATGAGAGAGSGLAGTIGAGAGKAVATSAILKSVAAVAVVAAVGTGAAARSGLIHVPVLSGSSSPGRSSSQPGYSGESSGAASQQGEPSGSAAEGARAGAKQGAGGQRRSAQGQGTSAGGSRGAASRKGGGSGGSGRAASARGHGRSHAGGRPRGHSAAAHENGAAAAHTPRTSHPAPSPSGSGASHSRRRSHVHRASHRHRSPPRHTHHNASPPPAEPRPPKPEGSSPPSSEEAPSAGASSAGRPALGE